MPPPPRYPTESEFERLVDHSEPAFALEWDSGAPGPGAGATLVYPWQDGFVIVQDVGDDQVYPSLRAAIVDGEAGYVTPATTEVESPLLGADELAALLTHEGLDPVRILVNGEPWHAPAATEGDPSPAFRRA